MPNQSYSFDKILLRIGLRDPGPGPSIAQLEGVNAKDVTGCVVLVNTLLNDIALQASSNPDYCLSECDDKSSIPPTEDFDPDWQPGWRYPRMFRSFLRDTCFNASVLPLNVLTAGDDRLLISPNIYCTARLGWIAIRIDQFYSANDLIAVGQPASDVTGYFKFCRWEFATCNNIYFPQIRPIDPNKVEISDDGIITRDNFNFYPNHWAWPYAAWHLTGKMKSDAILNEMLRKSETNPLTSIIKSGHPHRAHGLSIAKRLQQARDALAENHVDIES